MKEFYVLVFFKDWLLMFYFKIYYFWILVWNKIFVLFFLLILLCILKFWINLILKNMVKVVLGVYISNNVWRKDNINWRGLKYV